MKLLFDQNLSRKLVDRLADVLPDSSHVQFHKLAEETDTKIWEFAKLNDFCIVTQDADFPERSRLTDTTLSLLNGHKASLVEERSPISRLKEFGVGGACLLYNSTVFFYDDV